MVKTMRKGAIVEFVNNDEKWCKVFGTKFFVDAKEGQFLKLISLNKPHFGICTTVPVKNCKIVTE